MQLRQCNFGSPLLNILLQPNGLVLSAVTCTCANILQGHAHLFSKIQVTHLLQKAPTVCPWFTEEGFWILNHSGSSQNTFFKPPVVAEADSQAGETFQGGGTQTENALPKAAPSGSSGRRPPGPVLPDTDFIPLVCSHLIKDLNALHSILKVCSSGPHSHHLKGPRAGSVPCPFLMPPTAPCSRPSHSITRIKKSEK